MSTDTSKRGFTIIEVVLVLAIAGLIFLMVFLALPALQRSQRDSQRKNDLSRVVTSLASYQQNNKGAVPAKTTAAWQAFGFKYLTSSGDTFIDPSGANSATVATPPTSTSTGTGSTATAYEFQYSAATLSAKFDSASTQNVIYAASGYTCGTDGAITVAGDRKVALRMYLEGGGVACVNN